MKIAGVKPVDSLQGVNEFAGSRGKARDPAEESQRCMAFEKPSQMKIAGMNPSIFLRNG
jgi:hypothetical protein